jgi:hypothetical protein
LPEKNAIRKPKLFARFTWLAACAPLSASIAVVRSSLVVWRLLAVSSPRDAVEETLLVKTLCNAFELLEATSVNLANTTEYREKIFFERC